MDGAMLGAALGIDPDVYLQGQVRVGASADTIIEDVATRSGGLVRLSRARLDVLTQAAIAAASPSQSEIDAAMIEAVVGMPVGPYLRQTIAEGRSASHVRVQVSELSGITLPISRVVDVINDERAANGPYAKPKHAKRVGSGAEPVATVTRPARTKGSAPVASGGAKSGQVLPLGARTGRRHEPARGSAKWLSRLERDLAQTLSVPTAEFIIKYAKIGTARGLQEREVFADVANRLIARGARSDLTPQDVKGLLRRHGWQTVADRKTASKARAASSRKSPGRRQPGGGGSGGAGRGFWAGIANQRHVRSVSGGLPSLGKRS